MCPPCRVVETRRNDPPEVAEGWADYHEAMRICEGKSFAQTERRHLLAMRAEINNEKNKALDLRIEINVLKSQNLQLQNEIKKAHKIYLA